jgi:hypothetical protein
MHPDLGSGGVDGGESGLDRGRIAVELQREAFAFPPELVEGAGCGDGASSQDHRRVTDALHLFQEVRRQQDGDAELVPDPVDQLEHGVSLHRV